MSITSSIDIAFFNSIDSNVLINQLLKNKWFIIKNSKVSYLPLEEEELFSWVEEEINETDLFEIFKIKKTNNQIRGVILYYKNSEVGITLLIFNEKEITFNLDINRKVIDSISFIKMTDVNWYLYRLLPALENFNIEHIKISQG